MLVQIARAGTCIEVDGAESARAHFDRHHWLKLPNLLARSTLTYVQRELARAAFTEVRHTHVSPPSIDVCMEPNALSAMLELLCNDPVVLRAVEALTGCTPLVRFDGFVYRLAPGTGHHHNWHNDVLQGRRVAMSINLEAPPYEGGNLLIRSRQTECVLAEIENRGPGDAVLFRIDPALQHRATAVTRGTKTAFAGWFRSEAPLRAALAHGAA